MLSDWKLYERGGIVFAALEPHMAFGKKTVGKEFYHASRFMAGTRGKHLYWFYGHPEYQKDGIKWLKRWIKQGVYGSYFKVAAKRYAICQKFLFSYADKPAPSTPVLLLQYYKKVERLMLLHTFTLGVSIDAFDDYFPEIFAKALQQSGFGKILANEKDWSILQQAAYQSVVMQYRLAIIKLAQRARKDDIKNCAKDITRIWQKYFWLDMGWSGTKPLSMDNIKHEVVKQMKVSLSEQQREQKAILHYAQKIKKDRRRVIRKYKIPNKVIEPYLKLLDECARLHDERKEIQMHTLHETNKIRAVAVRLHHLKLQDVEWLKNAEFEKLIKTGKMPYKSISQRKIGYCIKYAKGRFVFEKQGKAALAVLNKELFVSLRKNQEIKGAAASPGIARGRAIVTDDAKVAAKMIKQGDVIIASMTTPDFVPAMKKAGAVVTNEGGVTAHAAIVSRELGIPCLTGTLVATRVFKTGDIIEVDADKGVVRKIK